MKIWLLKIGEPVPTSDGFRERLHRTGMLSSYLEREGHDVTWWTSTFDRVKRVNLFDRDVAIYRGERQRIVLLHGPGYRKSISFSRVRDQRALAGKFLRRRRMRSPRISSFPPTPPSKCANRQ